MPTTMTGECVSAVTRFSTELPGSFEDAIAAFEANVPAAALATLAGVLEWRRDWETVVHWTKARATRGFLRYWKLDIGSLMAVAGGESRCVSYLIGNHVTAQRLFRDDARAMASAPLLVSITQDPEQPVLLTSSIPSSQIVREGAVSEDVAAVGEEADRSFAGLLTALGARVPDGI
jgi:hypothetical protein